jgi:serine/threonine-protein kinase
LLQKLATGGMAEIYIARREGPHGFSKRIALKRILPQLAADPEFVAMFIDEARLCAQLTHPNLVQVFDFGEEGHELYMAMELVEGTTAAKVVRAAAGREEPVPTEVALQIALSVGRGLAHAHEAIDDEGRPLGLIHRDVSPGNILISRAGAVKLGDFGIARAAEFDRRTDQGQLKGKLGYMSPEQVTGRELDPKSDQFTAAIVLAELLTARPLFSGAREMDVLVKIRDADISVLERYGRHIPSDIKSVLTRALCRRRDERFATTAAYVDALEEVVRRRRLTVNSAILSEWLNRMGIVKATGRSGEHALDAGPAGAPAAGEKARQNRQISPLPPKASGAQPIWARGSAKPSLSADSLPPTDAAPAVFRALHPDITGPISLADLVEHVVAGRVLGHTPVSRNDGDYKPARDHIELARLCGGANALWDEAAAIGGAHAAGKLRSGELPGRLFDLALRRVTGALVVRHLEREKKVFFVDGVPEVTVSNDEKERLGAFLVARNLALPMEVEMALAMAPRYGGRLGDALVGLGVLRPIEIVRAHMEQMRLRFVELVGWKRGQFSFVSGARSTEEETMPEAFNPIELITRGIVEGYSYEALLNVLAPLDDSLIVPLPRAPVSVASLKLGAGESAVLESISGRQTLSQIANEATRQATCDHVGVLRAVLVGLSSGSFVSPAWPPPAVRDSIPTAPP